MKKPCNSSASLNSTQDKQKGNLNNEKKNEKISILDNEKNYLLVIKPKLNKSRFNSLDSWTLGMLFKVAAKFQNKL